MKHVSRIMAFALLLPMSLLACDDEEVEDHADDVASVRITAGTQVVTVNSSGTATGSLTIPRNTQTSITAAFLAANGSTLALPNTFQINLNTPANVTFGRTGNFTGTLSGTTAGTFTVGLCLMHIAEQHCDWGGNATSHAFSLTVQ